MRLAGMRKVLVAAVAGLALAASAARAQAIWSSESSYPVRGGNQVRIMVDGETAFADIVKSMDRAQSYIYVTFAFLELDFRPVPPDTRTIRDILAQAAQRGVDVRVVIWSSPGDFGNTVPEPKQPIPGFNGGPGTVQARWDVAKGKGIYPAKIGCHHQKSFMMDSPTGDIAYVGGMNSLQSFWDTSQHDPADPRRLRVSGPNKKVGAPVPPLHDLFASIHGPVTQDVISNFRERYNQATFRHTDATQDLPPAHPEPADGVNDETQLQLVRTIAPKTYPSLPNGERSIREAYLKAIASARQLIYIEDQYLFDTEVIRALRAAAQRGVKVIALLTRNPNSSSTVGLAIRIIENARQTAAGLLRQSSQNIAVYTPVIAAPDATDPAKFTYHDIYVHAKDMIVDDRFVTLGSANLSTMSLEFHSELNILLNDPVGAQDLRARLWAEHLQLDHIDPAVMADPAAGFLLWRQHAEANVAAWKAQAKPLSRVFPEHLFSPWSATPTAHASDTRVADASADAAGAEVAVGSDAQPAVADGDPDGAIVLGDDGAPQPE